MSVYIEEIKRIPVDSYGDVRTLVRGLPYQCPDDWEEVLDSLNEGSNLYLVKDPNNPKDKLAIAAYLDDRRVGYVASSDNGKIWLFLTDEKMPCTFLERFDTSFKVSFENPRSQFEEMSFEEIYKDKEGITDMPYSAFEIPFLPNPKDKKFDWFDDRTYIMDLEKYIPDFRRKLAARMIIFVGRKNSKGKYCYYLPYANNIIADIEDDIIKGIIDEHGFVIALPDVPMKTEREVILLDLHVTYLTGILFWTFDTMHQSEFVFHLRQDTIKRPKVKDETYAKKVQDEESYEITDLQEGGKHVSMGVIVPKEGDEDFDFCSYNCSIRDKDQISLIKKYMKRFEEGKDSKPFLMIGRPLLGVNNINIFYSLDGEIIFNFIFDEEIKSWIREAGFVLGKVISYKPNIFFPEQLDITLSVSKRKSGESLFKHASEKAMDYIEEVVSSTADFKVEGEIIDAVNDYLTGKIDSPYQVAVIPWNGLAVYTTIDGKQIGIVLDSEIQELAENNKGIVGYITDFEYDDDETSVEFTIRVSRSIPRLALEQDSHTSNSAETWHDSSLTDGKKNLSTLPSISEGTFSKFISDNFGCDVSNAPNSSWEYDTTKFLGNDREKYESYIFKKKISGNPKCKEIQAAAVIGVGVNFCMDIKMNKKEIIDFVYRYKKLFFPDYTLTKCKKEYGDEENLIYTEGIRPPINILLSDMGVAYFMGVQTSFCNKAYIDKQKETGNILTHQK